MSAGDGDEGLSYYAVAVTRRDNPSVNFHTLKGKVACFPGEFLSVSFRNISLLRVNDVYIINSELMSAVTIAGFIYEHTIFLTSSSFRTMKVRVRV